MNRFAAVEELLRPATFDASVSLYSRRKIIKSRTDQIQGAMPFLTTEEQARAREWMERHHRELKRFAEAERENRYGTAVFHLPINNSRTIIL